MSEVETNGDLGGRLPQPTEEVHLPDPSFLPVIVAFSTMFVLIGIITFWPVAIIAGIVLLITIVRWIRSAREEMRQLPLEH